ncbi:uncharacterized protein DUF58 [Pacificibacter maritimus]|uniref:Uncharacterized protein DUF58 n=1 Tax=Pacificibacter maritimus TaxID=762213 RepID=A0A3N4U8X6_9RHOB|nr:DUF58 domain-containing protein [Pacificibacter maritimus]RPE67183.1 uncharacterized protein DUF58 [Pacificibacter maritimus]
MNQSTAASQQGQDPQKMQADAQGLAANLPALMAQAHQLARTVSLGFHGRKRGGAGTEFWQYRPATVGDPAQSIDWRRSAQSDDIYVREHEWQTAQTVHISCDNSAAMHFASSTKLPRKSDRAAVLALASAILLMSGGERVGLAGLERPASTGPQHLNLIAAALAHAGEKDYGAADVSAAPAQSRALIFSDFFAPFDQIEAAVGEAVDRGLHGVLCQILDPAEESFPYSGRTVFTSMGGSLSHETLRANDLKDRYMQRLAERKAALKDLARRAGWRYSCHHTDAPAAVALRWVHEAVAGAH